MPDTGDQLVVRGGTVVTAGGRGRADVVVREGRIAAVTEPGGPGTAAGVRELDATGCFVLPGGIDVHVHLATAPIAVRVTGSWTM